MKHISKTIPVFFSLLLAHEANSQAPGWFTKVTADLGLQMTGIQLPSGVDINNDGYPDIVTLDVPPDATLYTVRKPMKIYLNTQDPQHPAKRKFVDITAQKNVNVVPPDTGNHANCFTVADFNNDGNVDLVTGNFFYKIENYTLPNDRAQVFLGDGTGNFTWVPDNGLPDLGLVNVRALSALDFDKDGNLDLFIAAWFKDYTHNVWDHGYLLKGNGDGTFTDVTMTSGIGSVLEPMYGSAAMDFDNDCYPDILTAPYCRTGGKVFKNDGSGHFNNVADLVGYDLFRTGAGQAACTFSVIPEDVNNDGYMDAFLSVVHGGNGAGQFRSTIAINKGPEHNYSFDIREDLLPVSPPASPHRGDYDGAFLDFDNDGLKDLVMVQGTYLPATDRTYFWMQQGDHSFKEVTADLALLVPELKSTGAVDVLDFDLDGDDDLMIQTTTGAMDIWQNNIGQNKHWIAVKLTAAPGYAINGNAIGARIYVYAGGGMQMRELMAGRGQHTGQQPFIMNFGLGNTTRVDSVMVRWPDRNCSISKIYNPPVNTIVNVNSFPVAVQETERPLLQVKVFPNPTSRYLVVQGNGLVSRVTDAFVTDAVGKRMPCRPAGSDSDKLLVDLADVPPGIYFINIACAGAPSAVYKIIRE